jgi:hypothetical protein
LEDQQLLDVLNSASRHFSAFLAEARTIVGARETADDRRDRFIWKDGDFEIIPADRIHNVLGQSLEASAEWSKLGDLDDMSQRWPDGNVDTYGSFVVYGDAAAFPGVRLGLGCASTPNKDHEVVGFVMGAGSSKRPLTVFFPADDYADSGELLSLIRGKDGGRRTFSPSDELPIEYAGFSTDVLGNRIQGKWNVRAVLAKDNDEGRRMMLTHTAIQARLRDLI